MKDQFNTPILICAFNRPDNTKEVFDSVRAARPKKLFIATDGPRKGNTSDLYKCEEVKNIFKNIDWECDVKTLFRDENLGCPKAIPGAIDWMFSYVDEGIILEDDCVPNESFFQFCSSMLEKYRDNDRIMMVGGTNFFPNIKFSDYSYFFSRYSFIWGWATWKRAWVNYDAEMKTYTHFKKYDLSVYFPNILERFFWRTSFNNKYKKYSDGWGVKWTYTVFSNKGLGVVPEKNLVTNIGSGPDATVTKNLDENLIVPTEIITPSLKHPKVINENVKYNKKLFKTVFLSTVNPKSVLRNYLKVLASIIKKCLGK